jgi:hypothetical protein
MRRLSLRANPVHPDVAMGAHGRPETFHLGAAMKKMTLELESLAVETFATAPEMDPREAAFMLDMLSRPRQSCIEQCTTSCVP